LSATKERLTLDPIVVDLGDDDDDSVDELIINSALVDLISEDGPKAQAFCDMIRVVILGVRRPFGGQAGGRAALSITPYMNRSRYCRRRNYC
jgi:hypothetical protein